MKRGGKRGQMHLSFGMIFSIILIIVFIAFAFYAIKKLIGVKGDIEAGQFIDTLQNDVDRVWRSTRTSEEFTYTAPSKISHVCFVDFSSEKRGRYQSFYNDLEFVFYENENLVFYPVRSSDIESTEITHIDIQRITGVDNPFCIEKSKGEIKMTLKKDYNDDLVLIEG